MLAASLDLGDLAMLLIAQRFPAAIGQYLSKTDDGIEWCA